MATSADIRERDRKRAYGEKFPDTLYYLTDKKLFIYRANGELTPRLTLQRANGGYTHKRGTFANIRACLAWAREQPEFRTKELA